MTRNHGPDQVQPELQFAAALVEAAAVVNSSLDSEQVLDRILEQVSRVVFGDTYNIMLVQGNVARIVRWRGYESQGLTDAQVATTVTPITTYATFQEMMATGKPVVVPDTLSEPSWVSKPQRVDHRSYVGAPIRICGQTEGFINVNSAQPNQFTVKDAERLRAFADHAAIALRNAELFLEAQQHAKGLERRVAARTRELQARTAWSEAILQSTSDGIAVTDTEGNIIQTNPITDRWLKQSLRPADAETLRDAIRSAAAHAPECSEQQLVELDGIDLELCSSPVVEPSNRHSGFVVAIHDITHLRALDKMRAQFISDVSHELRTPIASIKLYTSLIQTSPSDRHASYWASLDQELDRITRLVESILQIARLEAGRIELKSQIVDINLLVSSTATSYATTATSKGLKVICHTCPEPLPVSADPAWLIQAFNRIIENALLYTDNGMISLKTETVSAEGRQLARVIIKDTGIGIPENEVPYLFNRFFRGEEARTRQIPGSGLGLAISKTILDMHGSEIHIESEIATGSTVTILLPLVSSLE